MCRNNNYLISEGKAYPIRKKRGKFSKNIVIFCVILAVIYTTFCMYMQYTKGFSPDGTLTAAWFGFITVELWNLAKIKREKKQDLDNFEDLNIKKEDENEAGAE